MESNGCAVLTLPPASPLNAMLTPGTETEKTESTSLKLPRMKGVYGMVKVHSGTSTKNINQAAVNYLTMSISSFPCLQIVCWHGSEFTCAHIFTSSYFYKSQLLCEK